MAQRVVLHVGAMKSGTSYVQRLLLANRDHLADRGVLFPGRSWRDQVRAVSDLVGRRRVVSAPPDQAWDSLVRELGAWPGTGIVSMEFLGPAGPDKIERAVSSFAPGTVEVVLTARDLARTVPAMWQETLKNGRTMAFDDYVATIARGDEEQLARNFWREQALARIGRRWSEAVGPERTTLVTLPPPGADPGELWLRFARAAGIEATDVAEPPPANESLGAASTEVLRRLNLLLEDLDFGDYAPVVKHQLAQQVLGPRRREESAVGFEPPEWLLERSAAMVTRLGRLGVRLEGDLGDLTPVSVPGVDPTAVAADERLDAAVAALAGLVRRHLPGAGDRAGGTADDGD